MSPPLRKAVLTVHIVCSVGWLGAVVTTLALALAGLLSADPQVVRGAYILLAFLGRFVLVPLSAAALFSGLVQSLGTAWGVFRHYWVIVKLGINLLASVILLVYLPTLNALANRAAGLPATGGDLSALRNPSPVLHASGTLVLLLGATVLSVYKPRGVTPYGWRKQRQQRMPLRREQGATGMAPGCGTHTIADRDGQ